MAGFLDFDSYYKEKEEQIKARKAKIDIKSIFDIMPENDKIENLNLSEKICTKLNNAGITSITKLVSVFSSVHGIKKVRKDILTDAKDVTEVVAILCINNLLDKEDIYGDYRSYMSFIDSDALYAGDDKMREIRTALNALLANTSLWWMCHSDRKNPQTDEPLSSFIDENEIMKKINNSLLRLFDAIDSNEKVTLTRITEKYDYYSDDQHVVGMHKSLYEKQHSFLYSFLGCAPHLPFKEAAKRASDSFFEDLNIINTENGTILNAGDDYEEEEYWRMRNEAVVTYFAYNELIGIIGSVLKDYPDIFESIRHRINYELLPLKLKVIGEGLYERQGEEKVSGVKKTISNEVK